MKLRPIGNRILAKRILPEKVSKGIILPDSIPTDSNKFEVIRLGDDLKVAVNEGNTILAGRYDGQDVVHDGETYTILNTEAIIAVFE